MAVHAYLALNKGEATSLGRAVSLARGRFDLDFGHVAGEAVPGGWRLSFYTSGKAAKAGGKGSGAVVLVANLGGVNVIKKES